VRTATAKQPDNLDRHRSQDHHRGDCDGPNPTVLDANTDERPNNHRKVGKIAAYTSNGECDHATNDHHSHSPIAGGEIEGAQTFFLK